MSTENEDKPPTEQGWQVAQRQRKHPGRFRVVLRGDAVLSVGTSLPLVFLAGLLFESFLELQGQRVAEVCLNVVTVVGIIGWTLLRLHQKTLPWKDVPLLIGCLLLLVGAGGSLLRLFPDFGPELFLKTLGTIVILFALDRMERKRVLSTLRDSEEYLESIFESIPDPLFVIGEDRHIVAGNRVALSTFGEDVLGETSCESVLGHTDCSACTVTEVLQRKKPVFEIVRGESGARRYEVTTFPLFGRHGFSGKLIQQIRDVSSQSRMEDDASLLHDAVNSVKDPVLILDLSGDLLHKNRAAESLVGVDPLGAAPRRAEELLPFQRDADRDAFLQALHGQEPWEREVLLCKPEQSDQSAVLLLAPIRAVDERLLGTVVLVRDVTEVKSLQRQLIQNEKLSAVGELVSGVAHELNNPLTAVFGFAQLLLSQDLPEGARSEVQHIFTHAERCRKIIEGLLKFARDHQSEQQRANLNEVIQASLDLLGYQLRTANINVDTELASSLPDSMLDPFQLQQVMINLVTNAQHAIEARGITGQIKIRSSQTAPDSMVLEVTDNGGGMSEDVLNKIFDPFFTTKEVGKGTGLGLALCYGIVREHGGKITPLSQEGVGTTFRIELPVVQPPAEVVAEQQQASAAALPRMRMLIVDDEPVILELLCQILETEGHEVVTCEEATAALQEVRDGHFDVVFTDWRMPGMGGEEFYDILRQEKPELRGRVVFITGDTLDTEVVRAAERDGNCLLNKPFTIESLETVLHRLHNGESAGGGAPPPREPVAL